MRGDLALDARLALRAEGLVGLLAAIGGGVAAMAAYLPWYEVTASVAALGRTESGPAATLAGWQAHPWGWVVPTAAGVAVVVGLSWAIDRPVPRADDVLLAAGVALSLAVAAAGLWFPPVSRFDVAGSRLRDMTELVDRLPSDVDMSFVVHPGAGLWASLGAALVVILAGVTVRSMAR